MFIAHYKNNNETFTKEEIKQRAVFLDKNTISYNDLKIIGRGNLIQAVEQYREEGYITVTQLLNNSLFLIKSDFYIQQYLTDKA